MIDHSSCRSGDAINLILLLRVWSSGPNAPLARHRPLLSLGGDVSFSLRNPLNPMSLPARSYPTLAFGLLLMLGSDRKRSFLQHTGIRRYIPPWVVIGTGQEACRKRLYRTTRAVQRQCFYIHCRAAKVFQFSLPCCKSTFFSRDNGGQTIRSGHLTCRRTGYTCQPSPSRYTPPLYRDISPCTQQFLKCMRCLTPRMPTRKSTAPAHRGTAIARG